MMWKKGDKVYSRFDYNTELEVVSSEESTQPFYQNGLTRKKTKPIYPVEWTKVKQPDGTIVEYMAIQLVQFV